MTVGSNACPTVTRSSDSISNMDVGAHSSSVKALSSKLSALGAHQWPERSKNQTPQLGWPSGSWHSAFIISASSETTEAAGLPVHSQRHRQSTHPRHRRYLSR